MGVRGRAEFYYQQLAALAALRHVARREFPGKPETFRGALAAPDSHDRPDPRRSVGGLIQTPHRFRTKRQFWSYIGLALKTYSSGEYRFVVSQLQRSKKALAIRGLNHNHNHDLKNIFKGAATLAAAIPGPFEQASGHEPMRTFLSRLILLLKRSV